MRVAVLAPTDRSLYSRLVAWSLGQEPGVQVVGVVVRNLWSWKRLRGDLRREGPRLVRKVYTKLVLGDDAYADHGPHSLAARARAAGLPGRTLRQVARALRAPYVVAADLNGRRAERFLRGGRPDVIAFTGGGLIRGNILEVPRVGTLNCHSGILPRYRGMDVVEWALLECEGAAPDIGLTLHFMDRGVDTGPILLHHREPLYPRDTLESLRARLEAAMVEVMLAGIRGLRDGTLSPQPQARSAGRQYFVMHPRLKAASAKKLRTCRRS
jgi:folate-dependent phosphoribosylglycinamide formyltransferase PurN